MKTFSATILAAFTVSLSTFGAASAEVVTSGADHYTLRQEAVSSLPPEKLWDRLIKPSTWWSDAHTYSGDADNLSLQASAGGAWRENWEGNSVLHGTVLLSQEHQVLRLSAPFGPLQNMGVTVVWTITLKPNGDGASVEFLETATGGAQSALDKIAPAVDSVKQQAIENLVRP